MTTPTPGTAGDPQRPEPADSDPTREIEVEQPAHEQPAPVSWAPEPATEAAPPRRPSGPHLPPVLLGIVCLAIAGLAIWQEVTDVQVDWGNVGPLGIVAIGALLVLLGLVGLLGSRRRNSS